MTAMVERKVSIKAAAGDVTLLVRRQDGVVTGHVAPGQAFGDWWTEPPGRAKDPPPALVEHAVEEECALAPETFAREIASAIDAAIREQIRRLAQEAVCASKPLQEKIHREVQQAVEQSLARRTEGP